MKCIRFIKDSKEVIERENEEEKSMRSKLTNFGLKLREAVEGRENNLINSAKEKEQIAAKTEDVEAIFKESRQKSACANCVHGTVFSDGGYCYLRRTLFVVGAEKCDDQKTKTQFLLEGGSSRTFNKARWEK